LTRAPSTPRPRYGRLAAASSALLVTLVALLGGIGVLPPDAPAAAASGTVDPGPRARLASETVPEIVGSPTPEADPTGTPSPAPSSGPSSAPTSTALPDSTGEGKRVVFDMSDQRVWLVSADDEVLSSYLVSGSLTDNLSPGTFEVYSKSRWAVGVDDSGVMQYFVRFTRGDHAAIGFHSIPTKNGRMLQTTAQLGTPQSHGCIRQEISDAKRLWEFAPVGTTVVVTA
jgi:lipoprotein-anchoring transpeptidase ErfK/SrfK